VLFVCRARISLILSVDIFVKLRLGRGSSSPRVLWLNGSWWIQRIVRFQVFSWVCYLSIRIFLGWNVHLQTLSRHSLRLWGCHQDKKRPHPILEVNIIWAPLGPVIVDILFHQEVRYANVDLGRRTGQHRRLVTIMDVFINGGWKKPGQNPGGLGGIVPKWQQIWWTSDECPSLIRPDLYRWITICVCVLLNLPTNCRIAVTWWL